MDPRFLISEKQKGNKLKWDTKIKENTYSESSRRIE